MTFTRSSFGTATFGQDAAAAGTGSTGTLATTNANDSVAASGTTTVVGTLSKTNANDTISANGTTTVTGEISTTNANDSVSASGISGSITGTVAYINVSDLCAAQGSAGNAQGYGGGGYVGYDHYSKRKKSVNEERQRLGIIPKEVKKAIKEVVKENLGYGSEERANYELKRELERRDIEYKAQYSQALEQYRDHMIALEIYRLLKIKQAADDDDEEAAMWLLM